MRCTICKQADIEPGTATVTLERDGATLVVKGVPALVCPNCGEEYVEEAVTERLLTLIDQAAQSGVLVDVRQWAA